MKKVFAVLGSLMIVAGLKAQKDTAIKKETTAPFNAKGIDSSKSESLPEKIVLKLNELCEVQDPFLSKPQKYKCPGEIIMYFLTAKIIKNEKTALC